MNLLENLVIVILFEKFPNLN